MSRPSFASLAFLLAVVACGRVGYDRDGGASSSMDAARMDAGRLPDATRLDASGDGGPGAVTVDNLAVVWVTPNTIRWGWDTLGEAAAFDRFELVTAPTAADAVARTGGAIVWTAPRNPELGALDLPGLGTVHATITDELAPSTTYYARLTAIDRDGRGSSTAVASGTTAPPPIGSLTLFADADTPGFSLPAELARSTTMPLAGTHCYLWTANCPAPDTTCWENLRREEVATPTPVMSFETAYVEFAIAADPPMTSWYSEWRLIFSPGTPSVWYHVPDLTVRADGGYRVYQLPLAAFNLYGDRSVLLTESVADDGLFEFGIGSVWTVGVEVRMDEVYLRW